MLCIHSLVYFISNLYIFVVFSLKSLTKSQNQFRVNHNPNSIIKIPLNASCNIFKNLVLRNFILVKQESYDG